MKNQQFLEDLFLQHQKKERVATTKSIKTWALGLFNLLFPERIQKIFENAGQIQSELYLLDERLKDIIESTERCQHCNPDEKAVIFNAKIPELYDLLRSDLSSILKGDPAAQSETEIIKVYPGFYAIYFYRLAHILYKMDIPLIPRILTEYAHSKTGIDIHPGARIGRNFCIDHGTGIVIGETTEIGENVKIYQGVTLGALSVDKKLSNTKRHPTVEDNVVIYAGATILGGETIIGKNSVIGGNVWLTKSVATHSTVYHKPEIHVINNLEKFSTS